MTVITLRNCLHIPYLCGKCVFCRIYCTALFVPLCNASRRTAWPSRPQRLELSGLRAARELPRLDQRGSCFGLCVWTGELCASEHAFNHPRSRGVYFILFLGPEGYRPHPRCRFPSSTAPRAPVRGCELSEILGTPRPRRPSTSQGRAGRQLDGPMRLLRLPLQVHSLTHVSSQSQASTTKPLR